MKIIELKDPELIKAFLEKAGAFYGAEFLCSMEWGKLFSGFKTLGVFNADEELVAVFNLKRQNIGAGFFYYYSPRGPIIIKDSEQVWKVLSSYIKEGGLVFWRVEPLQLPQVLSFKKTIDLQPRKTLLLDLSKGEEQLLKEMHQKTRYNIRLAEKKGLVFIEAKDENDFEDFWSLMQKTGDRDSFKIHGKEHYRILAQGNPGFIKLFLIKHGSQCLAAGLFSFYGNKVTYLHGASDNKNRQLMAPYLLQWEAIKMAKGKGYKYYDFFGVDEKKWPGVTRFKLGFGGYPADYAGTNDWTFKPFIYYLYSLIRKIKRSV